ncbi:AAA family ATPase [Streptomyces sp. P01-B04]|uniref:helix-turn-helix transcriptional regulator n=1 Tax=Streptomyces poriferorum TaxID=2798799 RepID=UPI001C5F3360|nr:LuxR family transcriptional regulator [Streptomyces poriferorum]MBW5251531.1 AAA family ATPase [Streptomyces poriferorum]MBW5258054.1 AAA family ATPase [Streptomyces poriferorum]
MCAAAETPSSACVIDREFGPEISGQEPGSWFETIFDEPSSTSVLEICGDRWTGKSLLLSTLAASGARRGRVIASGCAVPRSRVGMPFGVFVDALDDVLVQYRTCHPWSEEQAQWLKAVFPALSGTAQLCVPTSPVGRYHLFSAVRALLEHLGSDGGLLITLDDLHCADEASMELVAHLVRHPPAGPVLMALAYRPRQLDHNLQDVLNQAVANGRAKRVVAAGISREAALALLPEDMSRVQCNLMLDESDRNPGLLKAYSALRSIPGEHAPIMPRLPLDVLTDTLRDFRALSDLAWQVARAAAVLGEPFIPANVGCVACVSGEELCSAIDELVREDLLRVDIVTRRLRFSNPLLRAAAYQTAGTGWLFGAHGRAAPILAQQGGDPLDLAGHLQYAAVTGDTDSSRILLEAAAETLWTDPGQAATWAATAMDMSRPGPGTGPETLLLGSALMLSGKLSQGMTVLDGLRGEDESHPIHLKATLWRAWALRNLGRPDGADQEIATALKLTGGQEREQHALLLGARLENALAANAPLPEIEEDALLDDAAGLSAVTRGWLYALLAMGATRSRATEHAVLHRAVACRLLDQAQDDEAVRYLDGLYWLAAAESALGRKESAARHYERGLLLAERGKQLSRVPQFALAVGEMDLADGDLAGSVRHAVVAAAAAAMTDSEYLRAVTEEAETALRAAGRSAGTAAPHMSRAAAPGPASAQPPAGPTHTAKTRLGRLSKRELEVAVQVSRGRTNQQIARALTVSHKTVETHLGRIFKKLDVSSRAELATLVGRSYVVPREMPGPGPEGERG